MRPLHILLLFLTLSLTSCMKDRPEELPEDLLWNPELAFPLGKDRFAMDDASGFDTTLFEIDSLTSFPLWVDSVDVILEGSLEFDLGSLDTDIENIHSILFRVGLWNGFPDAALTQAYFYGPGGTGPIDSLFTGGPILLEAGTPLGAGDSIRPSHVQRDATVEEERIPGLAETRLLIVRALVLDPARDTTLIPFYPNYYLEAEVGCMLELSLEF